MELQEQQMVDHRELWKTWLGGRDEAFGELAEDIRPKLLSNLKRICHNSDIADDVVQEAMMRVFNARPVLRRATPFTYFLTAARHVVYDWNKKQVHQEALQASAQGGWVKAFLRDRIPPQHEVEEALHAIPAELLGLLHIGLSTLSEREREVFCQLRGIRFTEDILGPGRRLTVDDFDVTKQRVYQIDRTARSRLIQLMFPERSGETEP